MNGHQAKKIRQIYKRELRSSIHGKVKKDAELWIQMLRPKPKYLPTSIWKWGAKIYFSQIGQNQIYKRKF